MNQDKKDDETEIMVDILKSLKEKNEDIYDGLSKDQIEFVNEILNEKNEENADASNDSIEGEKYAKAIEDIANRIYNQNLIPNIKIKQIETNIYSFNDKEDSLMFDESDRLKCKFYFYNHIVLNGTDLETWIIETFKIPQSKPAISVSSAKPSTKKKQTKTTHYKK